MSNVNIILFLEECSLIFVVFHVIVKRTCERCDITIFTEEYYIAHTMSHSIIDEKCFKCNRSFVYKKTLINHLSKCEEPSSISCDLCFAAPFKGLQAFLNHTRKHTSGILWNDCCYSSIKLQFFVFKIAEFLYTCEICSKGFMLKSSMLVHFKIHGQDVESIDFCDKFYKSFDTKKIFRSVPMCNLWQNVCLIIFFKKTFQAAQSRLKMNSNCDDTDSEMYVFWDKIEDFN